MFFGALTIGVPIGAFALSQMKKLEPVVLSLLLFLTCKTEDINFVSMEWYRGTSKGFEVSLVDLVILTLLGAMLLQPQRFKIKAWPPGSTWYALYFFFAVASMLNSDVILYSLFELLKMLRMYLYFWVIYQYIQDPKQLLWYMRIVSVIFCYIFFIMLKQKYLEGMWQAKGPFPHQNSLVMYVNLFNCLIFAYALNAPKKNLVASAYWMGMFCVGCLCTIFTFSRGGMMFLGLGLGLVFLFSFSPKQINIKKIGIACLAVLATGAILYKASDSITERFETAPEESMNVRAVLAIAATNMANDKRLGVGLNQFGMKINPPYWYGEHIERKEPKPGEEEEKGGLVETVYLMVAAECGWHTLVIYLIFVWSFAYRALRIYFKAEDPVIKAMALGLSCGLTSIYLESAFEWVLKQSNNFYQLMGVFALILALGKIHEKLEKQKDTRRKQALKKKLELHRMSKNSDTLKGSPLIAAQSTGH